MISALHFLSPSSGERKGPGRATRGWEGEGSFSITMRHSASIKRGKPEPARRLRRDTTKAEKHFWIHVRNRQVGGAKFRRQWPIAKFIVDFCCSERRLVVEIDGGQHADNKNDLERTKLLEELGYRVIRFWNNDVMENIEGVIERLTKALADRPQCKP